MTRKPAKQITKREIAAIHAFYAPAFDKTPPKIPDARSPRQPAQKTEPSESQVLKSIMAYLKYHPKVAKVWRQNSGTFAMQYGAKTHYVRANTARGMSDIMGVMKDGRTLAIEVKSRTGKIHAHQQDFLETIARAGGVAFVARDVETVQRYLDELI